MIPGFNMQGGCLEVSGSRVNDDLIADALVLLPANRPPARISMNVYALGNLLRLRSASDPAGVRAPVPTEAFGVPIVVRQGLGKVDVVSGMERGVSI